MENVMSKYLHPKEKAWIENYPFRDEPIDLEGCFLYRSEEEREPKRDEKQENNSKL